VVDGDQQLARLDDRLERVGELRDDHDLDGRLAVVRAKPEVVSGTDVEEAWRTTHEPSRCSDFFSHEK